MALDGSERLRARNRFRADDVARDMGHVCRARHRRGAVARRRHAADAAEHHTAESVGATARDLPHPVGLPEGGRDQ